MRFPVKESAQDCFEEIKNEKDDQVVLKKLIKFGRAMLLQGLKGRKEKIEQDKLRPMNSYILYCQDNNCIVKNLPENIGKKPKEITVLLSKMWRKEKQDNTATYQNYIAKSLKESNSYREEKKKSQ